MQTELDYIPGSTIIPEGAFGISPSRLHEFISAPWNWYRTEILGQAGFTGSTSSVLGTGIHFIAKCYARSRTVDKSELFRYFLKQCVTNPDYSMATKSDADFELYIIQNNNTPINAQYIISQYRVMGNQLIKHINNNMPSRTEELIKAEILQNIYVCGSCDALIHDRKVIDYKTISKTTPPSTIPYNYRLQLLCYAYIYKKMGLPIDTISIVWITHNQTDRYSDTTGKKLQDYPCQVTTISESITTSDFEYIENMLTLVSESILATIEYPHLRHIIWKDYRLKVQQMEA